MTINEHTLATLTVGHIERFTREVTSSDIARFAELSGDQSPVHSSPAYAADKGFDAPIAHGLLLGAYVSALIGNLLPGKHGILQSCELEFRAPLIPPEQIEISGEVTAISLSTGQVALKIAVKNAAGRLLVSGRVKTVVREPSARLPESPN